MKGGWTIKVAHQTRQKKAWAYLIDKCLKVEAGGKFVIHVNTGILTWPRGCSIWNR